MRMNTGGRLIDHLAIGVILLNFTNLYTFFAGLTGLSFKLVGSFLILFMLGYCLFNMAVLGRIFKERAFLIFLVLFFLIPIATTIYTPYVELRYIAYTVNSALIFLVTSVWVTKNGWRAFSKMIFISWCICILGILLSYFIPSVFMQVALLQEASKGGGGIWQDVRIAQSGQMRAFGFYMQSNRACHAVMLHLLVLIPFLLHDRPYRRLMVLAISFFAILLTGSRAGFLICLGFSGLLFYYELRYGVKTKRGLLNGFSSIPKYVILVIAGIVGSGLAFVVATGGDSKTDQSAVERIFVSLFSDDVDLINDLSVQARVQTQLIFIDRIIERPLFGRGHASDEYGKYTGIIPISAHNMMLDLAYQYGIPMMLSMYGFLFYLAFSRNAKAMIQYFRFNPAFLILAVLCVYTFVSNTTFDLRMFPSLIGFLLVTLYLPRESMALRH